LIWGPEVNVEPGGSNEVKVPSLERNPWDVRAA
jgi:hypothetical protein